MINKNNGHIKLNDSLELTPKLNFGLIESQNMGEVQETRDMGNGYKWLDIKNLQIGEKYFTMALCFKGEELSELRLGINDNPFDLNLGWDSWGENDEKEKLKKYQDWLCQELGKERKFNWGEAWVSYDPKGGFSSIGIRYK